MHIGCRSPHHCVMSIRGPLLYLDDNHVHSPPSYIIVYLLTHRVNKQARLVASGSPLACRSPHHCVMSKTGPLVLHYAVFLMGLAANCTNKRQLFNVRQSCGKDSDPVLRNIRQVRIYIYIHRHRYRYRYRCRYRYQSSRAGRTPLRFSGTFNRCEYIYIYKFILG